MKSVTKNTVHLLSRNILSTAAVLSLMGVAAFAAAPTGGYLPGATLNPDCTPGSTDCSVVFSESKFVDGTSIADAVFTGGKVGIGINNPTGLLELQNGTYNELKFSGTDHTNIVSDGDIYVKSSKASGIIKFDGDGGGTNDLVVRLGKVGVGTIVPLSELHVSNSVGDTDIISENTVGAGWFKAISGGINWGGLKIKSAGTDRWIAGMIGSNTNFHLYDSVASESRLTVDSSTGNVGIGTTTPSTKLDVIGQAKFGNVTDTKLSTYTDSTYSGIYNGSSLYTDESIYMGGGGTFFVNDGTESMRVSSSGNVGIGTSAPSSKLHIAGNAAEMLTGLSLENANSNYSFWRPTMNFYRARGTLDVKEDITSGDMLGSLDFKGYAGGGYRIGGSIHAYSDGIPSSTSMPGRLSFSTTGSGTIYATERLTIKENGNVGIGTTNPTSRLQVVGSDQTTYQSKFSGGSQVFSNNQHDGEIRIGGIDVNNGVIAYDHASADLLIGNTRDHNTGDIKFRTKLNNAAPIEAMTIIGSGNIGIGVTTPEEKLDVNGKIKSSSLAGTYTGGSAYVCVYDSGVIYASETACP